MAKLKMGIDAKVLYQMYEYAAFAKTIYGSEIVGYGHYREKDGIYKLAPLTKQIATAVDVESTSFGIINDVNYDISDMIVQWHSHVEMSCFFSGTDQRNIKDALKLYPMLISIVVNVKQEYAARLDIRNIAYGKHIMTLPEDNIVTFDLELVPYYSNDAAYNEVKNKLKPPRKKPVRAKIFQPNKIPSYYDIYDDSGWSYNDDDWENSNATVQEELPLSTSEGANNPDIMMMAGALCRDHSQSFRLTKVEQTGTIFITHHPSHTFCTIDETIAVNGQPSDWAGFLRQCGENYLADYAINTANKERVKKELEETIAKKMLAQDAPKDGVQK